MLGHGTGDADNIGFLKGVVANHQARHLPRERHDWYGIHEGIGDAGHDIRRAGAGRDETDADFPCGAGVSGRRVNRALLVPH